jgi:hypothetical protein
MCVVAQVDDLMRHDDMAARIDRRREVVADLSSTCSRRRHGAGIRVGERDLSVRRCRNRLFHGLKFVHLASQFV